MNRALVACLAFTVFALYSCTTAGNRMDAKVAEIRSLRDSASNLVGESGQIERDRPGLFTYLLSGVLDGAAMATFGVPIGATAIPVNGDVNASKRQKEIVQELRSMQLQEQVLLAEARGHLAARKLWLWLALGGMVASIFSWNRRGTNAGSDPSANHRIATS